MVWHSFHSTLTFHQYANNHFVISTEWTKCHWNVIVLPLKRILWQYAKPWCDASYDMWGNYMPAEYEEDEFFTPYVFDYKPNMNLNGI